MKKPTIAECCELLSDTALHGGMLRLLSFLSAEKMAPSWYHKTSFKCNYNGKRVLYINFGEVNWLRIRVCTVSDMHGKGNMDLYMQMLSDEVKAEYMNYLANFQPCKICKGCGGTCERRRSYYITNPTAEQFLWIEKFILARKDYIDNPLSQL